MFSNLYVHFPFCRAKCSYCALYSRANSTPAIREAYVKHLINELTDALKSNTLSTVYFGGGSPAFCDLRPLAPIIARHIRTYGEFTVELHPLDVTDDKLLELKDLGVNRISMGMQSLDDRTLIAMGRGYTVSDAARAFAQVKKHFDNAGIDLIVGYPGDKKSEVGELSSWGLRHCSVYSLQNERALKNVPPDDWTLDRIREIESILATFGLRRYEISNYAALGYECRHNLAVWRGEDYLGIGEGASGRIGLTRTFGGRVVDTLSPERDKVERTIFRLRTFEGLDASHNPEWLSTLDRFVAEGLLTKSKSAYFLTSRGREVCDTILEELV